MSDIPLPSTLESWDQAMERALVQARMAGAMGEVPVGAVVYGPDGRVLSEACNAPIALNDPTAHAEIIALRRAADALNNYRLTGCVVVCTLESCLMCVGAMIHARVAGLVFGASDPKSGAVVSRLDAASLDFVNHRLTSMGGVMADQCGDLLRDFFRDRR